MSLFMNCVSSLLGWASFLGYGVITDRRLNNLINLQLELLPPTQFEPPFLETIFFASMIGWIILVSPAIQPPK
jgi:hypothetical protein